MSEVSFRFRIRECDLCRRSSDLAVHFSRHDVGFVDDDGNTQEACGKKRGKTCIAALSEDHVGIEDGKPYDGEETAVERFEGVEEIPDRKVCALFSCNGVEVGEACVGEELGSIRIVGHIVKLEASNAGLRPHL